MKNKTKIVKMPKKAYASHICITWYKGSYTIMAKGNENSSVALTNDPVIIHVLVYRKSDYGNSPCQHQKHISHVCYKTVEATHPNCSIAWQLDNVLVSSILFKKIQRTCSKNETTIAYE